MARWVWAGVPILFVALGCSSGSGNASTGGGSCDSLCSKGTALSCATKTQSECMASCEADVQQQPAQCASAYLAGEVCLIDTLGCSIQNATAEQIYQACPTDLLAYASCMACEPESDDTSCDTCKKQKCCAERKAAFSNMDAMNYSLCVANCLDTNCVTACGTKYPNGQQAVTTYGDCATKNCPSC